MLKFGFPNNYSVRPRLIKSTLALPLSSGLHCRIDLIYVVTSGLCDPTPFMTRRRDHLCRVGSNKSFFFKLMIRVEKDILRNY